MNLTKHSQLRVEKERGSSRKCSFTDKMRTSLTSSTFNIIVFENTILNNSCMQANHCSINKHALAGWKYQNGAYWVHRGDLNPIPIFYDISLSTFRSYSMVWSVVAVWFHPAVSEIGLVWYSKVNISRADMSDIRHKIYLIIIFIWIVRYSLECWFLIPFTGDFMGFHLSAYTYIPDSKPIIIYVD